MANNVRQSYIREQSCFMSKKGNQLSEDDLLTYGKYLQIGILLQHSNRIQLRYKLLTLTWFLATFIGVGYSLSTVEVNLPFQPLLIASVLCIASLCVIGIIWYLDVILQEKNIASAVSQGLNLEEKHFWLPKAYHCVVQMHYLFRYIAMKSVFYLGCASILLLTICYSATYYLISVQSKFWPLATFGILLTIPVLFILSNWMTKRADPYLALSKLYKKK
jgi:hypothetical protein